jgi:hypothetical protein
VWIGGRAASTATQNTHRQTHTDTVLNYVVLATLSLLLFHHSFNHNNSIHFKLLSISNHNNTFLSSRFYLLFYALFFFKKLVL